jgi:hypothetical protein
MKFNAFLALCCQSKGEKMAKKNYRLGMLGILLTFALSIVGCSTARAMTQTIDRQASSVGDVKKFQYYVSRNIVLTMTEDPVITGKVAVTGKIDVAYTKNVIQITSSTEGELLKTETDSKTGRTVYHIAFETDNNNTLRFEQKKTGMDEKIYLLYDDNETHAINYGGVAYVVDWGAGKSLKAQAVNFFGKLKGKFSGVTSDENDDPYLMVKMNQKTTEKENYRKATGRKVGTGAATN